MKLFTSTIYRRGFSAIAVFLATALLFGFSAFGFGRKPHVTMDFAGQMLPEENFTLDSFVSALETPVLFDHGKQTPTTSDDLPITPTLPAIPDVLERPIDFSLEAAYSGADLPVEAISQLPGLPNGCEATSLAIVLQYLGYSVSKETIAYQYLPSRAFIWQDDVRYGADPEREYPGDPATTSGYYCYETPVIQAANQYLEEQGDVRSAVACSGASEEELLAFLEAGIPLIVWKTIDNAEPRRESSYAWTLFDSGETYSPYMNVHVLVLRGYTENDFLLSDPLGQETTISRDLFMELFEWIGSRVVGIFEINALPLYSEI